MTPVNRPGLTEAMLPWSVEAFFAWQESQDVRYELVGGFPAKMTTGASNRHDVIVTNIIAALVNRLRGTGCRPFTADGSVRTRIDQIRRPDAGVDGGPFDPDGFTASEPQVLFEVLSPSTRDFDRLRKIDEYKALPSLRHVVIVETLRPEVTVWSRRESSEAGEEPRGGAEWTAATIEGLAASIDLRGPAMTVLLDEIYDRIGFDALSPD